MSGGPIFLIRCVVVEVLGTEGWIIDANYLVKHAGTVAFLACGLAQRMPDSTMCST